MHKLGNRSITIVQPVGVEVGGTVHCSGWLMKNRSVSGTGNRHPIPTHRVPAVAMIGLHVARHWAAGDGGAAAAQ